MKTCPNCKASVIDTAKFCHKCRFNIKKYEEEQESSPLYCTECGAELQADASFCTECGADVANEIAESCDNVEGFNFDSISSLTGMANEQMYAQNGLVVENGVLTGYTGKKRTITIYGSIEEIYDGAFENNQIITCVEIEEGIKSIGRKAFASCPSLVEISIPASCKFIYEDTFKNTSVENLILTSYNETLLKLFLSANAKSFFDRVKISDYMKKDDNKVTIYVGLIEKAVIKLIKEEEERKAEEKRKEQLLREKKLEEERRLQCSKFDVGTQHFFGRYEHGNGLQNLEWIVLERKDDKALLVSKYIIDGKKFHEERRPITWEGCTLRRWLNNDFYNEVFSSAEKSKILTTETKNAPNPVYNISSGIDTHDKVFLLSYDDVKKYFKSNAETKCQVTLFAKNKGAYCDGAYFGYWWLRTTGQSLQDATYIFYSGGISDMGYDVTGLIFGVRPAMWISLA